MTSPAPRSGTPRLLRQFQVLLVVLLVGLGAVSAGLLALSRESLTAAAAQAAGYARMTTVGTLLLQADAAAAKGLLADGQKATAWRQQSEAAVADAAALVVEEAAAHPAHGEALADLNVQILAHGRVLERALTLSDGDAAASTLVRAGATLREEVLPVVADLQARSRDAAAELLSQQQGWLLPVIGWAVVAVLVAVSWQVAKRSRRVVNLGLAAAIVATGTIAVLGGTTVSTVTGSAITARDGAMAGLQAITTAQNRVADAHGVEVLTVLSRTGVAGRERDWQDRMAEAEAALADGQASGLEKALADYREAHEALAALVGAGDWDAAGTLVAATDTGSPSAAMTAFEDAAAAELDQATATVTATVTGHLDGLLTQAVVTAVLALAGTALAVWGLGQRLKEYR